MKGSIAKVLFSFRSDARQNYTAYEKNVLKSSSVLLFELIFEIMEINF